MRLRGDIGNGADLEAGCSAPVGALAEVVEPRYDELFTLVQAELRRSGYEDLIPAGIVLTGGMTDAVPVEPGSRVAAHFTTLGSITIAGG